MNIEQYLKNQKMISKLQEENKIFLQSIQEDEINKCLFKERDVIKGIEYRGARKKSVITIQSLQALISDNGIIKIIAKGWRMNLDGTHCSNGNTTRTIIIDENTLKLR